MRQLIKIERRKLGEHFFTTGQVANICGVAPRTVAKWIDSGSLKGYRIPGSQDRRVMRDELIQFMRKHNMPESGDLDVFSYCVLLIGLSRGMVHDAIVALPGADNYAVRAVEDAFEAGMVSATWPPTVAVIDLLIGRPEGCAIAGRLQKSFDGVTIIGLAVEDETNVKQLHKVGFDTVLKAPIDTALLMQTIRAAVE